jgi:FlaG/FlaF family flagellin (archaellin)
MFTKIKKDCRGVSLMIAYIMLVSFVIVLGIIVYNWMKSYVPQEEFECPDDVSLFIQDYNCDSKLLSVTLRNNGKFNVGGYFIYATTASDQELASKDLSPYAVITSPILSQTGGVKFSGNLNSLAPGEEESMSFDFSEEDFDIFSIEIIPLRWEEQGRRVEIASCTQSKIKEDITCI